MTGETLKKERLLKMIVDALPCTREMAVSAPMEQVLGPVMSTVFPSRSEAKVWTSFFPVAFRVKEGMADLC